MTERDQQRLVNHRLAVIRHAEEVSAHWMLPWSWGTVLVMHCIVPIIVLTVLGWSGLAVLGFTGFVHTPAIWPLALVVPFAAAAVVTPAAISAARRPFPVEVLITGAEGGSLFLLIWLISGPGLAAIVFDIALGAIRDSLDLGVTSSTFGAIMILVVPSLVFLGWLFTRKPPD